MGMTASADGFGEQDRQDGAGSGQGQVGRRWDDYPLQRLDGNESGNGNGKPPGLRPEMGVEQRTLSTTAMIHGLGEAHKHALHLCGAITRGFVYLMKARSTGDAKHMRMQSVLAISSIVREGRKLIERLETIEREWKGGEL